MAVDKSLQDLEGKTNKDIGLQLFESTNELFDFGIATTNAFLQIFGSLSWRTQADRNLFNQDFKVEPAWSISFGHRASRLGTFPNFNS